MPPVHKVNADRVRELLAKGCTQTQVAKRLGYSKNVVCQIANGKYASERSTT